MAYSLVTGAGAGGPIAPGFLGSAGVLGFSSFFGGLVGGAAGGLVGGLAGGLPGALLGGFFGSAAGGFRSGPRPGIGGFFFFSS